MNTQTYRSTHIYKILYTSRKRITIENSAVIVQILVSLIVYLRRIRQYIRTPCAFCDCMCSWTRKALNNATVTSVANVFAFFSVLTMGREIYMFSPFSLFALLIYFLIPSILPYGIFQHFCYDVRFIEFKWLSGSSPKEYFFIISILFFVICKYLFWCPYVFPKTYLNQLFALFKIRNFIVAWYKRHDCMK